jgi:hypothetical protein
MFHNNFFPEIYCSYVTVLGRLNLNTLCTKSCHLHATLLLMFIVVLNSVLSYMDIVLALLLGIIDFPSFAVGSTCKRCPSSRCVSAENTVFQRY